MSTFAVYVTVYEWEVVDGEVEIIAFIIEICMNCLVNDVHADV